MTRFATNLVIRMLACIAVWPVDSAAQTVPAPPIRSSPGAGQTDPTRLEPGQPVTRAIAADETHRYRVALQPNYVLHVVATQLGADIVVTLLGSDGKPMVEMDTPTGTEGAESIWFVAPTAGEFTVEVRVFEGSAGRYELRADALREATPDDAKRVQMQALFLEATRLGLQRTPDAQQSAIGKFREAAALARSVGERDMAALSVRSLMGIDIGAGLESVALPSLPGKVPVHYSPGYEQRAANLRDRLAKAVDFFEQRLGVTPKVYLAVLAREHWTDIVGGTPYGMPNSATSRSGAGLVCLSATHDAFDELGRSIKANLPDAALKAMESAGLSFEEGMPEFGEQHHVSRAGTYLCRGIRHRDSEPLDGRVPGKLPRGCLHVGATDQPAAREVSRNRIGWIPQGAQAQAHDPRGLRAVVHRRRFSELRVVPGGAHPPCGGGVQDQEA